jgi:hypothetical protein
MRPGVTAIQKSLEPTRKEKLVEKRMTAEARYAPAQRRASSSIGRRTSAPARRQTGGWNL